MGNEDEDLRQILSPTAQHRGIVSETAGLFVLKTGYVDSLVTEATNFLLVILPALRVM